MDTPTGTLSGALRSSEASACGVSPDSLYFLGFSNVALVAVNLACLCVFLWARLRRQVKYYDRSVKALEDEQGEWYVNLVIERELAKLYKHYSHAGGRDLPDGEDEEECECADDCDGDGCDCACHEDDCGCDDDCDDDCDCDCHEDDCDCSDDCPDDCECECHDEDEDEDEESHDDIGGEPPAAASKRPTKRARTADKEIAKAVHAAATEPVSLRSEDTGSRKAARPAPTEQAESEPAATATATATTTAAAEENAATETSEQDGADEDAQNDGRSDGSDGEDL